jgi:outer membrane protein insertion porin family
VDAVLVSGNTRTRDAVITRFVPFTPGDVLDVDDPRLELTKFRLLGTGFFRDATLSLRKGLEPGHVSLVVNVVERNTVVVNDVWMGLAASADTSGDQSDISSFAGIDAAETNLLGTGITLGVAAAFSADQQGFALRYHDPAFLGSPWMLDGELLRNDGLGFFGNAGVRWDDPNQTDRVRRQAVVSYKRRGVTAGLGRDLGVSTQAWVHLRAEQLNATLPRAASHVYGGETEPLQFHINKGASTLTTLRFNLYHDTRDQPILPTRGMTFKTSVDVGLRPALSDYSYQKVDIDASWHVPLAHNQVLSLFGFVGLIAGHAPFIDQYYVGDLSDFRPGRVLGLSFDDRPAPNLLDTAIEETRYGDFAAKVTAEYRVPLFRGSRSVYGVDFFVGGGVFALADQRQFDRPPRNRNGLALLPIDLTASLGVKLDTSLGGFSFSVSNLIGFAHRGRAPEVPRE